MVTVEQLRIALCVCMGHTISSFKVFLALDPQTQPKMHFTVTAKTFCGLRMHKMWYYYHRMHSSHKIHTLAVNGYFCCVTLMLHNSKELTFV